MHDGALQQGVVLVEVDLEHRLRVGGVDVCVDGWVGLLTWLLRREPVALF